MVCPLKFHINYGMVLWIPNVEQRLPGGGTQVGTCAITQLARLAWKNQL